MTVSAIRNIIIGVLVTVVGGLVVLYVQSDMNWHQSTDARIERPETEVSTLTQRMDDHQRDDDKVQRDLDRLEHGRRR
jgi:hypothetical protein